jgi:GDP-4-dehydro-6-deoxy-D-mannose reductase
MKKLLITGASGFIAGHFIKFLSHHPNDFKIHAISRTQPAWDFIPSSLLSDDMFVYHKADMMDMQRIRSLIEKIQPEYIIHLAAQSSVSESWNNPVVSFMNNTNIFLNIIDAIRLDDNGARVLSVGSSEQYGIVSENDLPLKEESPQRPANPYAVARVAQEQLARIYSQGYGLDICCTRSFNHCGPGQSDRFVVSGIVKQFVRIARGIQEPVIHMGNGSIIRDFIDVRDAVTAYNILLTKGKRGDVYNVCTGSGHIIRDIVLELSQILNIHVEIRQEQSLIRPIDNPRIIGSNEKMQKAFGWHPTVRFDQTLLSMYDYWKQRLLHDAKDKDKRL